MLESRSISASHHTCLTASKAARVHFNFTSSVVFTYTLYRMSFNFGGENPALTKAIRNLSASDTQNVQFVSHAETEMENDGFDHNDVLVCLRKGTAYGPEMQRNQLRANVLHRGIHINVVVAGLDGVNKNWALLERIKVITVMKAK